MHDWKASLFGNLELLADRSRADGAVFYDLQPLPELAELRQAMYIGWKESSERGLSQASHAALIGHLVHG